ncbi:aminotransferase class V-fold PLP-dependent enzyme, partial [Candidatus Micrarchaeota archaeon]|nr:aminotransferase class V-fold PLP-dependent enzyme [Candidatus Micrarchaeota archaeon]
YGACAGRSGHQMGTRTNEELERCRENVARFVGAKTENLVWTRNTTEGLNLIANGLDFSKKKKVVTTVMEHHSALLPFLRMKLEGRIELTVIKGKDGIISLEEWEGAIDRETAIVVTNSMSNTTAIKQPVREIAKIAHDNGALICTDGAQGVPHQKTDFGRDGLDFLCFSGHKMLGSTGIGVLIGRKELLSKLKPTYVGGGTVKTVSLEKINYAEDNNRLEAGIQNYAGVMGLSAAVEYLKRIGMDNVEKHEKEMASGMLRVLEESEALIYGRKEPSGRGALYSFNFKDAKPHELAQMLDKHGIQVRSGFFCAQPAMENLGAKNGAVRASCYIYNTSEEINKFEEVLGKLKKLYS